MEEIVEVVALEAKFPVRYAKERGCDFLLRGVPSLRDYHEELALQTVNHGLEPLVKPVYLLPDPDEVVVSSKLVRGMIGRKGWDEEVKKYIPVPTWEALMAKFWRKEPR